MNNNAKPIVYMVTSSFMFATLYMLSKCASSITPFQKSFISNFIAIFIISVVILKQKTSFWGNKKNQKLLLLRGLCGSCSLILLYYSIEHLCLAQSTMLNKLSPLFASVLGYLFLKDKISAKQIILFIFTLIGMLLIIKPCLNISILPFLVGILSSALAATAFFMIRLIGHSESAYTVIFYNLFFSLLINLPFSLINFRYLLSTSSVIYMIFGGFCIAFGQLFLTRAYSSCPASNIAIYDYSALIFSGIYDYFIFQDLPDYLAVIGYVLIIISAFLNAKYSKNSHNISVKK